MPDYYAPGVYIEEPRTGPRPIQGVGTDVAAFVGFVPHKESEDSKLPILITNWTQYVDEFGHPELDSKGKKTGLRNPYAGGFYLAHAVRGFFDNGGGKCYVYGIKIPPYSESSPEKPPQLSPLQIASSSGKESALLTIKPKAALTKDVHIEISEPQTSSTEDPPPPGTFNMTVQQEGSAPKHYNGLNLSSKPNSPKHVTMATRNDPLIEVEVNQLLQETELAPQPGKHTLKAEKPASETFALSAQEFVGSANERSGVHGMEIAEDVRMVCCPDLMFAYQHGMFGQNKDAMDQLLSAQLGIIEHCQNMKDRIAILDAPPDMSVQQVKHWRQTIARFDTPFAALYYPWVQIMNPDPAKSGRAEKIAIPPSGHMAGIYARNDRERGVHKAPANEIVKGVIDVDAITQGEQEVLNPIGVNCIRAFAGRGIRVWGARTLSTTDTEWRYINVRRLFSYIEKSIENETQWVVFEPNNHDLWARIKRDVGAFLTRQWREGRLFGQTPEEAFYVKCDEELNPPDRRDNGELIVEIGLAPVKPAEFVIFRFKHLIESGVTGS
jgi:hypothetical protein